MERLHFSHMSDNELVMLSDEGVEYQIAVDDTLRSAIKRASGLHHQVSNLPSPREIQELVREGKSIAEICDATGGSEDYVVKFAQPVLDELNHIVESAKAVRISLAGDRFSEVTQIEFGALIASRLSAAGAKGVSWTSHRVDLGSWQIRIDYDIENGSGMAIWTFDPRKLVLTPENEAALGLSSTESLHSALIPKLKPVSVTSSNSKVDTRPGSKPKEIPTSSIQETIAAANLKTNLLTTEHQEEATSESLSDDEDSKRSHLSVVKTPESLTEKESSSHPEPTSQLLSEIRSKRSTEPQTGSQNSSEADLRQPGATRPLIPVEEPTPVTTSIRVVTEEQLSTANSIHISRSEESQLPEVEPEDEVLDEARSVPVEPQTELQGETTLDAKPEARKGRPGIPSWDEIVFGTKTDDQ